MNLQEFFEKNKKVAVAFSGGIDSAYLLFEAKRYAESVMAYYVKSAFQPQFELEDAISFCEKYDIELKIIELDILAEDQVVTNDKNRCYYCKQKIFSNIVKKAKKDGYDILLDGTNGSDDADDRPGMKALQELSVASPLRLCNITKDEIRTRAKEAGIALWNKPSYACLATRILTGKKIEKDSLRKTEQMEDYLMGLGFSDFRIRMIGEDAKIEVCESELSRLIEKRREIVNTLKKEYKKVLLDLEVRDES